MAVRGGKGRCGLPRASPSTPPRNRSSASVLSKRGWVIAAALMITAAGSRDWKDFGAAADIETGPTSDKDGRSVFHKGERTGISADRAEGRRLHAFESTDQCLISPLWSKTVDPANYEFGCKEIQDMLHGPKDLVGHGRVREVYFVEYEERVVVVKTLRETHDMRREKAHTVMHRREVLALDAVRGHPNVVGMLGVCNTTLVTEYYSARFDHVVLHDKTTTFSIDKVVSMALDAARGLQALHEASAAPIVHLDMKPQQLLIDENGRVKVNDLNSARFMGARASGRSCPFPSGVLKRVVAWRAPENIAGKALTEKVDIYSMGMILYSLMARTVPFPDDEGVRRPSFLGRRPDIDPSWHAGYMQVVQDMWQREPTARPSARQVVARLQDILDSLPA